MKKLESKIYTKQLTIYDKSIEILDQEEVLVRHQIDRLLWYERGKLWSDVNLHMWRPCFLGTGIR